MAIGFKVSHRVGAGWAGWLSLEMPSPPSPDVSLQRLPWLVPAHLPSSTSLNTSWERPFWTPGLRSLVGQSLTITVPCFSQSPGCDLKLSCWLVCCRSAILSRTQAAWEPVCSHGLFAHCSIHGIWNPLKSWQIFDEWINRINRITGDGVPKPLKHAHQLHDGIYW